MRSVLLALGVLGLVACGNTSSGAVDPVGYAELASSISKAAHAHATASAAFSQPTDCEKERTRYAAEMGAMMDQMQGMSGGMDACMASMGHGNMAMMGDGCTNMAAELDRHLGVACASTSLADQASEASTHADRMMGMASSEESAAQNMGSMMGGSGMMNGSGMMSGSGMSGSCSM